MKKRIVSFILIIATLFSITTVTVNAAAKEEFLSDVALVYEDTVEEARAAIAGTDWKLLEYNLNENADYMIDDGVYLIYKTSENVEDAITDLRVMDMYGGYSISNYEKQLEKSRAEYRELCDEIRIVADEFKARYVTGDAMAKLAYRQLNYYIDAKTQGGDETGMLMGEFFLNLPKEDEKIVQVFFEGNSGVVSNLLALLAIGLSGVDNSLSMKVADFYEKRDTLTDEEYHDDAVALESSLKELAAKIVRYDALKDKYTLEDDMTEEECQFIIEIGAVAVLSQSIKFGEKTLYDILKAGNWTYTDMYPLVAAFSEGQMALAEMGMFEKMIVHATPSDSIDKLTELVEKNEAERADENGNIEPIDVYIGVDRSVFTGSFAMTTEAQRQQALTGETWGIRDAAQESKGFYIASCTLAVLDAVAWCGFAFTVSDSVQPFYWLGYWVSEWNHVGLVESDTFAKFDLGWTGKETWTWQASGFWFWSAVGIALIAAGLSGISTWYNYYNPDYTVIPDTLIDVRETDIGDKYVKYTAAKVYEDVEEKDIRNADFNAYEGREWVALYYTKDANAGNSLTSKFVVKENNDTVARRHQGISMFGEDTAYNLNTHAYNDDAVPIYVTVRYSNTKKAAADLPDVVGSIISEGALYVVTAVGGIGVGAGATLLTQAIRKKRRAATGAAN